MMKNWKTYHGGKQWTPSRTRTGNRQLNNFQAETSWHQITQPQKIQAWFTLSIFPSNFMEFPPIGYFHHFFAAKSCLLLSGLITSDCSQLSTGDAVEGIFFGNIPPKQTEALWISSFVGTLLYIYIYQKNKYIYIYIDIYETIHVCIYIYWIKIIIIYIKT